MCAHHTHEHEIAYDVGEWGFVRTCVHISIARDADGHIQVASRSRGIGVNTKQQAAGEDGSEDHPTMAVGEVMPKSAGGLRPRVKGLLGWRPGGLVWQKVLPA